MKSLMLVIVLLAASLTWMVFRDLRMQRDLHAAISASRAFTEQIREFGSQLNDLSQKLENQRMESAMTFPVSAPEAVVAAVVSNRIAAVENAIRNATANIGTHAGPQLMNGPNTVPEYDPTQPPHVAQLSQNAQQSQSGGQTGPGGQKRSWGQEQATGAPDTHSAGDIPTAWASLEPDGGPEWLTAGFDNSTEISEVRIRETYNPGAISKVTAFVNGSEVTLWEGTATGGQVPRDFVVKPPFRVNADSIVVHLDSARVAGWNEIDAIELVGKDGSRQWASSTSASSTYAERPVAQNVTPTSQR
jgi:hypothetical protein